jgi:dTDP-4-amino-4,6-dideoxygalactose transaminase
LSATTNVPLLDLKPQYAAIRDEIAAAVQKVLESQQFILGPAVDAFEREMAAYCGVKHAVSCASGSDAIMLALLATGLQSGDEVLCPSYTFFATAGYVVRAGGRPVFAEIDPATYNIDPEHAAQVARRCKRLKAIMPVHLFGQVADLDPLLDLGRTLGVPVIEDAAQAIGARDGSGMMAGTRGAAGCFSFFPSKNLGAYGDGGMVSTNDDAIAERLRILRMHGASPKYYHRVIGANSRLDSLQAAVLSVKLRHLEDWHRRRQANADHYDRVFLAAGAMTSVSGWDDGGLPLRIPARPAPPARHIYNQYTIRVPAALRDPLREHLKERGVGTEIY